MSVGEYVATPPTLVDGDLRKLRLDSTGALVVSGGGGGGGTSEVEVTNFPATQPVSGTVAVSGSVAVTGPLTNAQLTAQALATEATLASVLTELQTLNAALVTANGHLANIETNTAA